MEELQSDDHRQILDIIDQLRFKGVSQYVALPQIVVCGDQSAGKSSVLEAISRMSFPTKDNLCTRFATELILRRQVTESVNVSITPGPERTAAEQEQLKHFYAAIDPVCPDLGPVVEKAKEAMGLSSMKTFSSDILRVELSGPRQPNVTLVDLPGLFRAGNREQTAGDARVVRKMVRSYIKSTRSIILAVVSAKSDAALQEITEMAREMDPEGLRTLGLITKPDVLDIGSDSEAAFVSLARNEDVRFRLGWHVLKNRDYQMRNASSSERDAAEQSFFRSGVWATVSAKSLGVQMLKPRLSSLLKDQILWQLPGLIGEVSEEISNTNSQLKRLGAPRTTPGEQRKYLLQVSREFTYLMQAAVDGVYNDPFFGNSKTEEGYQKRLRARIQNILADFSQTMRQKGRERIILDSKPSKKESPPHHVLRSDFVSEVKQQIIRSRGRELSGTFNPMIIGELFTEQCQPWGQIVSDVATDVLKAVFEVAKDIVDHAAIDETASAVFSLIGSSLEPPKAALEAKIKELLEPHNQSHPITYNHYLTDTVQQAQIARQEKSLERQLRLALGSESYDNNQKVSVYPSQLLNQLRAQVEVDMERYSSELAVDYMQAYYKVRTYVPQTIQKLMIAVASE